MARTRKLSPVQQLIKDTVAAGGYVFLTNREHMSARDSGFTFRAGYTRLLIGLDGAVVRKLTEAQVTAAMKAGTIFKPEPEAKELPVFGLGNPHFAVRVHTDRVERLKNKKGEAAPPSLGPIISALLANARGR